MTSCQAAGFLHMFWDLIIRWWARANDAVSRAENKETKAAGTLKRRKNMYFFSKSRLQVMQTSVSLVPAAAASGFGRLGAVPGCQASEGYTGADQRVSCAINEKIEEPIMQRRYITRILHTTI